ncbi:MAG: MFS transporter, partial [Candidatus Humimicrobiaceae bacterium]
FYIKILVGKLPELKAGALENRDTFKDYLLHIPIFFALFLVPISYLSISPALIEIGKDLNTAPGNISLIFTFFPAGIVAGQLTSVFYNRRFKRSNIILTCYVLLFVINITLFFSKQLALFYVLSAIGGYLIGINYIQSTENILACKVKNKDRIITLMVTFYPLGALVAPLISSTFVKNNISWRYTYLVIAAVVVFIIMLYISISLKGQNKVIANSVQKITLKEIFVNRDINIIYFVTMLIAVIYIVGETVFTNWSPTYLRLAKNFNIQSAALGLTFFQTFIVLGRFIISTIAQKVNFKTILLSISGLALLSTVLFVLSNSKTLIYITISLAGLGFSAMYPMIVSSGSTLYNKGRGVLASFIFAIAYFGISMTPFITRSIAAVNLDFSVLVALIFTGTAALLIIFLIFFERSRLKNSYTKELMTGTKIDIQD